MSVSNAKSLKLFLESIYGTGDPEVIRVRSVLLAVRFLILLSLFGLASGLGWGAYDLLKTQEFARFNDNLDSAAYQVSNGFSDGYKRFDIAHQITKSIHQINIQKNMSGVMPYVTMPGDQSNHISMCITSIFYC